jgi:hypothetical protein
MIVPQNGPLRNSKWATIDRKRPAPGSKRERIVKQQETIKNGNFRQQDQLVVL